MVGKGRRRTESGEKRVFVTGAGRAVNSRARESGRKPFRDPLRSSAAALRRERSDTRARLPAESEERSVLLALHGVNRVWVRERQGEKSARLDQTRPARR